MQKIIKMKPLLKVVSFLILATSSYAFSTTNIQYLYGDFNGNSGFDTTGGGKHTVTLENFTTYDYGDFYGFVDYAVADKRFKTQDKSSDIYFELSPRISFSKLSGEDLSFLFVKDIYMAGQYNRQVHKYSDFKAWLYGVGADFDIKGFDVFCVNLYKKEQNFGSDTYQLSANYISRDIFGTKFTIDGFTDWTEYDFLSQNKLLYKLGYKPFKSSLYVGLEWHYYQLKDIDVKSNVAQAMIMFAW